MKTELSQILGNISNQTKKLILNSVIALALVGLASFLVKQYERRPNDPGLTSKQSLTTSIAQPFKKTLVQEGFDDLAIRGDPRGTRESSTNP
jgi:hypothetical protein